MAVRTNLRQQDQTREAIKTTQLVKRLQFYALGEKDEAGNAVDLDAGKLKAIEVLLRKSLPDLSSVTIGGDGDNPIKLIHKVERTVVRPPNPNG